VGWIIRIREDRHASDLGDRLLEQLQAFAEGFQSSTGSPTPLITIGIVRVAFLLPLLRASALRK